MGIQNWSEDIILVTLAPEPQMGEELESAIETATQNKGIDVVIDFADVDIVTSSSIAKLLKLRKALAESDRRLIFSSIRMCFWFRLLISGRFYAPSTLRIRLRPFLVPNR